jgi:hypothetical protein
MCRRLILTLNCLAFVVIMLVPPSLADKVE